MPLLPSCSSLRSFATTKSTFRAKNRGKSLPASNKHDQLQTHEHRQTPSRPRIASSAARPLFPAPSQRSKVSFVLGGVAVYAIASYGAYAFFSLKNVPTSSTAPIAPADQEDVASVYDTIAKKYDKEIWSSEFCMGMSLLRRALGKRAQGEVLESSAGTGRNINYYSTKKCDSITMVDSSRYMLEQARKKFIKRHPTYANVSFLVQDASRPIRSPSIQKFDTVIQSMGLCSHRSPVQLLRNLGEACKPEGKIILLEHGRSHYDWLNKVLDNLAPKHASTWGCWWNRDISKILEDSGLRVEKVSRYHFGTTYWIEARPPSSEQTKR